MSQALTVAPRGTRALTSAPVRPTGRLAPGHPSSPKARTPLSVVPARPARRRVPFAVFSLLVLAGALAAVLMLNISVSSTQYDLVQLRNQQVALSQENEALVLEIEGKEAPQNLAAAATKLDMVSSPTFGTIELDSGSVTGDPEPATKGPKPEVLIAAPNLVTEQAAPVAAPVAPVVPAAPAQDAQATDASSAGSSVDAATTDDAVQDAAGPVTQELPDSSAAGTIPGPVQSSTGGQ